MPETAPLVPFSTHTLTKIQHLCDDWVYGFGEKLMLDSRVRDFSINDLAGIGATAARSERDLQPVLRSGAICGACGNRRAGAILDWNDVSRYYHPWCCNGFASSSLGPSRSRPIATTQVYSALGSYWIGQGFSGRSVASLRAPPFATTKRLP